VRAVLETYRTSWLRGDAEGVLGTFTSDAVLLPAHGAGPVVGMEAIRRYWWPAGAPPTTITRLEITVEQIGGDCRLAYAQGRDGGTSRAPGPLPQRLHKAARWHMAHRPPHVGRRAGPLRRPAYTLTGVGTLSILTLEIRFFSTSTTVMR